MRTVQIEEFGKDHWSLFSFFEYHCINSSDGDADLACKGLYKHMSCNENNYPTMKRNGLDWNDNWSTRLQGYFDEKDPNLMEKGHCDFDSMKDLEEAGLIECGTIISGSVRLTEPAHAFCAEINKWKANGGNWSGYIPSELVLGELKSWKEFSG